MSSLMRCPVPSAINQRPLFLLLYVLVAGSLDFIFGAHALDIVALGAVADAAAEVQARATQELVDAEVHAKAAVAAAEAAAAAAQAASLKAAEAAAAMVAAKARAQQALVVAKGQIPANLQRAMDSTSVVVAPKIHTVLLQKQQVPVIKRGKLVANKTAFFGEIYIGRPQKAFTVVFDTGSGNLILPSTACDSPTCRTHLRYNRSASDSAIDIEANGDRIKLHAVERDQVEIAFGTGHVVGEFVEERVCLDCDSLQCATMRVVAATQMSAEPFGAFSFDGVLGIGLSSLALNSPFSFFGEMSGQNPAMLPYFAFFLAPTSAEQSSISFGGFDAKRVTSGIKWAPVDMPEAGYWQVKLKSVRVGDVELDMCADGECRAILDTGTSLLGVPRQAMRSLSKQLARLAPLDTGRSCLDIGGVTISFDLGSTVVNLGAEDYSQSAPVNVTVPGKESRLICKSLLMPVDAQAPLGSRVFIWGEPVLRKYYTVYDLAQKRIGFSVAQQHSLTTDAEATISETSRAELTTV